MFRFRLERILLYRQRQVDACTREVAMVQARLQAAEEAAAAAADELDRSRRRAADDRLATLDPVTMARQLAWHEALQVRAHTQKQAAAALANEVQAARGRLQEAWQDREVLQQLKERQRQEWLRCAARRERREQDETGSIRAALGSRTASGAESSDGAAGGR